ncbi:hypothetical protein FOPG_16201 [Fusarium oxysporum f. sp. conglutinans race 2 54008]|uniref:Uncharacterized protein n=1 Tax=Fusarium oxysporum f. sp. conglutinans race 2 54008 TaxID=1089457 RepID=X0GWC1_FUSOX|nr:hypothetical protein FOPG_16201 [Fusarium oxysporum f. sp. conglutinans race 2 54008]
MAPGHRDDSNTRTVLTSPKNNSTVSNGGSTTAITGFPILRASPIPLGLNTAKSGTGKESDI